jgi:hypothetical protein
MQQSAQGDAERDSRVNMYCPREEWVRIEIGRRRGTKTAQDDFGALDVEEQAITRADACDLRHDSLTGRMRVRRVLTASGVVEWLLGRVF